MLVFCEMDSAEHLHQGDLGVKMHIPQPQMNETLWGWVGVENTHF